MEQINLQDPLSRLAKETFLHVFSFLSTDETDAGAKVCRGWRECLRSDFSLFTTIKIKTVGNFYQNDDGEWGDNDGDMNQVIGKLSRLSHLSTHRLEDAYISLAPFVDDVPKANRSWYFVKLTKVFDILELSKASLKKLHLDGPKFVLNKRSASTTTSYISNVLSKLESYPGLNEVEITASTLLRLICKSSKSNGKTLTITPSSLPDYSGDEYDDPRTTRLSASAPYVTLIQVMKKFTQGELTHLHGQSRMEFGFLDEIVFSAGVLAEIRKSKEAMEEFVVTDYHVDESVEEVAELVVKLPNLTWFKLGTQCWDAQDYEFSLPKGTNLVSKLSAFDMALEKGRIRWDKSMLRWIGSSLEIFWLEYSASKIDLRTVPFKTLLQASSSTLKFLQISGNFFSDIDVESLSHEEPAAPLSALKQLSVIGNAEIINFFLSSFKFSSLQLLHLDDQQRSKGSKRINLKNLFDLVGSHHKTLETIRLSEDGERAEEMQMDHQEMSIFNELDELSLITQSEVYLTPFLKASYPKLELLKLSPPFERHRSTFLQNAPQLTSKK